MKELRIVVNTQSDIKIADDLHCDYDCQGIYDGGPYCNIFSEDLDSWLTNDEIELYSPLPRCAACLNAKIINQERK